MITYNPDGGDLGRANRVIAALEMQLVIPHVASILEELEVCRTNGGLPFKYAFEIPVHQKELAQVLINTLNLPPHVSWYTVDGRNLFEMRGASGGVVSSLICYLITGEESNGN